MSECTKRGFEVYLSRQFKDNNELDVLAVALDKKRVAVIGLVNAVEKLDDSLNKASVVFIKLIEELKKTKEK